MLDARERLIGGILIGNNVVNTLAASLTTGVLLTLVRRGRNHLRDARGLRLRDHLLGNPAEDRGHQLAGQGGFVSWRVRFPWIVRLFGPLTMAIEYFHPAGCCGGSGSSSAP